ncbi:MAG: sigma-54-dependent Fis family transcriptional regulator [Deltaproteobacteria bacterium]|nr:sigma-54-dependent Fis family transcriptional regulator [Deltaproteobacteria bacterium]MBW2177053.1 sigma-54-dependent Fis family transcriptional regulator [Deltaproteobacteria bacterium]MBW2296432.1 sigma-54-dependent Fis family transcriptional regulator [Deltaproteobacteria bacterium]MBW2610832.1 sigma-54-dependent Fis family transcriptional regulator [Deltaproteobacteria bacterium]MBW2635356.1 sigma-54-dependent Fis family transcriptional regulator [Deltaproteobacteria bacterium]
MSLATQIMVVDDEETICEALEAWFIKDGYRVEKAGSGLEALERMAKKHFDVYFVDIKMPGMDGLELLGRLKEKQPDANVIMITAHGSIQSAVEAMKLGACDYLCKPFDPDQLSLLMERVMASKALRDENETLREQLMEKRETLWEGFVAQSDAMHHVFSIIEDVAPTGTPVLITGETGVGKELIAEALHMQSRQSDGPFIAINCGAMSETLLESELFGHERGAFTGAVKARRGRLEMANNGTLFLDEIGEISSKMQVSLLRVLEEKHLQRLGGNQSISTHFRLLSATHRNLSQLIRENRFREDFFYRINVITLPVPPLRERLEDVPALADHFLDLYVQETGKRLEGFTQRALGMLMAYSWPGNVRELRNVIERAVVLARGRMIGAEELTFLDTSSKDCRLGTLTLHEVEISHVRSVLDTCNWNISRAAKQLDIDRSTLNRKIKRFHLVRS